MWEGHRRETEVIVEGKRCRGGSGWGRRQRLEWMERYAEMGVDGEEDRNGSGMLWWEWKGREADVGGTKKGGRDESRMEGVQRWERMGGRKRWEWRENWGGRQW